MLPHFHLSTRLKVILALTVIVLLIHMALLQAIPLSLGLSQTQPPHAFTTRAIELAPPQSPAPTLPDRPASPPAPKKPPPPARAPANNEPPSAEVIAPQTLPEPPVEAPPDLADPPPPAAEPSAAPAPPSEPLPSAGTATVPGSVVVRYKVDANKFPYNLNAELHWQQNGDDYETRLVFSAFGQSRTQTSQGKVTPQGLAPIRFSDKFRTEVAAHFERDKGKVTFSANTPDVALLPGAQDRLSILAQLAAMIASNPVRFTPTTTIAIQTIGPRDADIWLFTVGERETLALPGGEQATLKLVRSPRKEFDQKVELWLAPALGYLPVRIRITEAQGDFIDQQWLATESRR